MKIRIILTQKAFDQALERKTILDRILNSSKSFWKHIFKYMWSDPEKLIYNDSNYEHWKNEMLDMIVDFYFVGNKSSIKSEMAFKTLCSHLSTAQDYKIIYNEILVRKGGKYNIPVPLKENAKNGADITLKFIQNDFKKFFIDMWQDNDYDFALLESEFTNVLEKAREMTL